jgi:MurNAc alpha-1-phosphate uridylyltransferase
VRAFILAAGEGRRLQPLSLKTPKPLLKVTGKALIQYHIEALVKADITEMVINLSYLGEQIEKELTDGSKWGAAIRYSHEDELLETGGGIRNALPLLGDEPFAVVNGDIFTDYDYSNLPAGLPDGLLGHLVMVDNPAEHPEGDYGLAEEQVGKYSLLGFENRLTYSGISILHPQLLQQRTPGWFPLREVLKPAIESRKLTGEHFEGLWTDVGTVDRLEDLRRSLQ